MQISGSGGGSVNYVYNGKVISVPEGQAPPAGAIRADSASSGTGNTLDPSQFLSPAGGIDPSIFGAAQAQAATQAETTIPLWRQNMSRPVNAGEFGDFTDIQNRDASGKKSSRAKMSESVPTKQFTSDDALVQFYTILNDPTLLKQWQQLALNAGWVSPDNINDSSALYSAWQKAVTAAVGFKQASEGTVELTPFEAAKKIAENTGSSLLAQRAMQEATFTGDKTSTQSTVNLTDPDSTTLHNLLGRKPTAGELAAYRHGIQGVAQANPTKTTTTTHYEDGKPVSAQNVVTGGYDEQQAAVDAAYAASPEVAQNQAATTFYDALVQALRAAV